MCPIQPEVIKELQDNFSISLQYYDCGDNLLSNIYLNKCLKTIEEILEINNNTLIRETLIKQVYSIAYTQNYTYYIM